MLSLSARAQFFRDKYDVLANLRVFNRGGNLVAEFWALHPVVRLAEAERTAGRLVPMEPLFVPWDRLDRDGELFEGLALVVVEAQLVAPDRSLVPDGDASSEAWLEIR